MAFALGLLIMLVGLLVSIALHEVGHMVPAKRFGVRVSKYMVGFGPTLWSRTRGETEYGLKAIPLGGYVRLVGMLPPASVVGAQPRPGRIGEIVDAAREASDEEVLPGEEHRAFYRLSTPKKVVVMLGGPFMNLVIAVVLMAVVILGIGLPAGLTTTVGITVPCVAADDTPSQDCGAQDPATPAAAADLRPGDVLLTYGDRAVGTWEDFQEAVREVPGAQVPLVVERAGEQVTLQVSPVTLTRPVLDDEGEPVLDADGQAVTETSRFVGIIPTQRLEPQPVSALPTMVGDAVWQTARVVVTLPVQLWKVTESLVTGTPRDGTSVIGPVGVGRAAGEITSNESTAFTLQQRVATMLLLLASLNIALFVFNLIPLLPLDGGHVAGALWEGTRRQLARWRGLPRPAPSDVARMMPLAYGVFLVLAAMGLLLMVADFVRPVSLI